MPRSLILVASFCFLLCFPATSFAVTGIAGSGDASAAQYRAPGGDQGGVLGNVDQAPSGTPSIPEGESGDGVAPDTQAVANEDKSAGVQPAAQLSTDDDRLPFTGLSLLALGFVGALLLASGVMGRRTVAVRHS